LRVAGIEFGPVVDRDLHRLFLWGWDVLTPCFPLPDLLGVQP
jgi:hypothetical protein